MFRLCRVCMSFLCTLGLLVFQLSTSYAKDKIQQETLGKIIERMSFLPEEMQLGVLSKLVFPIKQQLLRAVTNIYCKELRGHQSWIDCICFSSDGLKLASCARDGTVRLWDAKTGGELYTIEGCGDGIGSICFSPDSTKLASVSRESITGSRNSIVRIWDIQTREVRPFRALIGHHNDVPSLCFSPDGVRLASGSWDKTIRIWDVGTGEILHTLQGHNDFVQTVCFSPDGLKLASGSWDKMIRIWDVRTKEVLHTLKQSGGWVNSLCFSPDGLKLASGSYDGKTRIWDVKTGRLLKIQQDDSPYGIVNSVVFSPDGSKLAVGTQMSGMVRIWDLKKDRVLQVCIGHKSGVHKGGMHVGGVNTVCFSPDGSKLASGSDDATVRIWDLEGRQKLIDEIHQLGAAQSLLLYVLFQNQKELKSNEAICLNKTETTLRQEYGKNGKEIPPLLNLRESYNSLSQGLKKLVNKTFKVTE